MSWSSLSRHRVGTLRAVVCCGLACLALGGCFRPEYASLNGNLDGELRRIAVDPVPDRLGHYLQDELITRLNGTGANPDPKYHLILTATERVQTALIDSVTGRAQNATIVTVIAYRLVPVGGGPNVAAGSVTSAASYDRSAQRFANIRAAKDAEIRDARTVADQITTRIAAALAEPMKP